MPINAFSHYPGGFTHGVTLRGLSILNVHYGNVFWVDSGIGNNSGAHDGSITKPFATIDYAVGRCTATNGDVILVAPGHAETISAAGGIDLDVAGISVIGLGNDRDRPTISFTATASDMDVDANDIYVENIHFDMTGIDAVAAGIDVNAAGFSLVGCDILMADSGGQATRGIVGATAADRMKILGCTIRSTTAGAASAINLVGTADGVEIGHNYIYGDFSVASIENATGAGNLHSNLDIHDNYIQNDNNGNWAIELVADSTGTIRKNHIVTDAIATAVDWGACSAFGNLYFDDGSTDANATEIPTAQTTGGMDLATIGERLGTDADTSPISAMLGGTAGITTIPAAAVPGDGVNVFELLRMIWANQCGTAANENGITTFPPVAAPANNVSMAEVLHGAYSRNIAGINPLGIVVFVAASGGSDSNAGTSPTLPKATIAAAITAAGAGGTVVLGPGTHAVDVSVAALTPLANQQFVSAIPSFGGAPRAVIANDADDGVNIVLVDVDGTVWRDIEFRNVTAATTCITQVGVAQTSAVRGIHFENCWFNQNSLDGAMVSLAINDATNATTGAVFKNCRFVGATGTTASVKYIQVGIGGAPSLLVERCVFECKSADNDARAIDFLDPGTSGLSYGITIRDNDIIGPADNGLDAVPLQFAAAMTEGEIIGIIRTNYFSNCATPPIPIDLVNNSVVSNYGNDNATGGTLVDPGT
ncbi:MAG: hypothetical protein NUW01_01340 [Gemmatimonadaceae bacterium]|nr:hypothetical protein [Gemmatimonadaceae bacterium]